MASNQNLTFQHQTVWALALRHSFMFQVNTSFYFSFQPKPFCLAGYVTAFSSPTRRVKRVPIALDFLKRLRSLPPLFFQELNRSPSNFSPLCFVVCVSLAINTHFTRDLLQRWVPAFRWISAAVGGGVLEISHFIFTTSLKTWKSEASLPRTVPTLDFTVPSWPS